jgi:hypothetical protein
VVVPQQWPCPRKHPKDDLRQTHDGEYRGGWWMALWPFAMNSGGLGQKHVGFLRGASADASGMLLANQATATLETETLGFRPAEETGPQARDTFRSGSKQERAGRSRSGLDRQ